MELKKLDIYVKQVKYRLGISTELKDEQITLLINGVADDMVNRYGIILNEEDFGHQSLIIDIAKFRYDNNTNAMPRHLDLRLKDLIYEPN